MSDFSNLPGCSSVTAAVFPANVASIQPAAAANVGAGAALLDFQALDAKWRIEHENN
jgi:hypothetical protein